MKNPAKTLSPEATAVLENQHAMAAASAEVENLERAIGDYTATVEQMRAALGDAAALESEREDVLAGIAIGEKSQADLNALDARIAKLRQERQAAQPGIAGVEQTIAGLRRRLEQVKGKLQQLRQPRPGLVRSLLRAEAEAEGEKYAAMGVAVAASYRRLVALDVLLRAAGEPATITMHGPDLHIPAFALASVKPHVPHPTSQASIYDQRWNRPGEFLVDAANEKAALQASGLEIE